MLRFYKFLGPELKEVTGDSQGAVPQWPTVATVPHSAAVATGQAKIIGVILCNFELRHRSAIERS